MRRAVLNAVLAATFITLLAVACTEGRPSYIRELLEPVDVEQITGIDGLRQVAALEVDPQRLGEEWAPHVDLYEFTRLGSNECQCDVSVVALRFSEGSVAADYAAFVVDTTPGYVAVDPPIGTSSGYLADEAPSPSGTLVFTKDRWFIGAWTAQAEGADALLDRSGLEELARIVAERLPIV